MINYTPATWESAPRFEWLDYFFILPKRCAITNKILWGCYGHKGIRRIYGLAGEPAVELFKYIDCQTFTLLTSKGTLNEETLLD